MVAGIEQHEDGRATFVAVKEAGWHQLGTVVDHEITVAEGLELAHLADLDYRLEPFAIIAGEPKGLVIAEHLRAVARRKPFDREQHEVIAAGMTDTFTLHTPEQAFGLGENLIDAGKPLAALGSIAGGRKAFAAFHADDLTIGGVDQIKMFLNVMTAFDGSMSTVVRSSAIRVVCQNTFSMVMGQSNQPTYKVRHVGDGLEGRVEDARAALAIGYRGMEDFQAQAEAFLAVEVTDARFATIVKALLPDAPEDASQITKDRVLTSRDQVTGIWNGSTVLNVQNTAWAALNAYTEWLDWTGGGYRTPEARMVAQITPGSGMDKRRLSGATKIATLTGVSLVGA